MSVCVCHSNWRQSCRCIDGDRCVMMQCLCVCVPQQLETELRKLQGVIADGMAAFDESLNQLFLKKIKVMMVLYQVSHKSSQSLLLLLLSLLLLLVVVVVVCVCVYACVHWCMCVCLCVFVRACIHGCVHTCLSM